MSMYQSELYEALAGKIFEKTYDTVCQRAECAPDSEKATPGSKLEAGLGAHLAVYDKK